MAWVETADGFHWDPPERRGTVTLVYKPGRHRVREACAAAAVAAGKAVRVYSPGPSGDASGDALAEEAAIADAPVVDTPVEDEA